MNTRRILLLAKRVMQQVLRDRRTVALIVFAPIIVLSLGAVLFRADPPTNAIGIVNDDAGITSPIAGNINLGQAIEDELREGDSLETVSLNLQDVEASLKDGDVKAVLVFPEDFTTSFIKNQQAVLDLRLEGSEPTRSMSIQHWSARPR